jgi:WD40 repeat protein
VDSRDSKDIKVTNCNDDSLITTLTGHTGGVTYLIIDDGKLYSGDHDGTIKIWNCGNYQFITNLGESSGDSGHEYEGHTSFVACLTINDGKLYSGSWDKTIKVWDCSTNKLITTLTEHTDDVTRLLIHGGKLYSQAGTSSDDEIIVYDCSDDSFITTLADSRYIMCLEFYDGKLYYYPWRTDDPIQHLTFQNGKLYAQDWVGDIYIWQL